MTARKEPHLHRKRGPKPKPKPPKRGKGRPVVSLRDHSDRYLVARFDVATHWWRVCKGERMGALAVLAMDGARQDQKADLRKAADRFRALARRFTKPADLAWRKAIGTAVAFTIQIAADPAANPSELAFLCDQILGFADDVGEVEWARRELLPLILHRAELEEHDHLVLLARTIAWIGWATEIEQWLTARDSDDRIRHAA